MSSVRTESGDSCPGHACDCPNGVFPSVAEGTCAPTSGRGGAEARELLNGLLELQLGQHVCKISRSQIFRNFPPLQKAAGGLPTGKLPPYVFAWVEDFFIERRLPSVVLGVYRSFSFIRSEPFGSISQ
jgi:hypothetical protein